jgi:hypothetical protein
VFYAAVNDAGVDASSEGDAGLLQATSCIATGAVRIACDAGVTSASAHFDVAATGDAVAFSDDNASRFTIAPDGGVSPMTAFPVSYGEDVRVVSGGGTVATITASLTNDRFTVLRSDVPNDLGATDFQNQSNNDAPAIRAAAVDESGTVYTFLKSGYFQRLTHDEQAFDAKLDPVNGDFFGFGPNGGPVFVSSSSAGFAVQSSKSYEGGTVYPSDGSVFAAGRGTKGEALVALFGPNADEIQIAAVASTDSNDFVHWTIVRDRPCGFDRTGCGYTCTEKARGLEPIGQFVSTNTASYFVTVETHVSRTRSYSTDFGVVCGIFGGCACGSSVTLDSVDGLDVVVLQIDVTGGKITERARARVVLADPKTAFFTTHYAERDVRAAMKDGQLHVAVQGATGEMARIILDIGK